jgi:hypothetical protein
MDQDEVEAFYVSGDSMTEDSLYERLSEDGSYQRPELEDIVAYLVSSDGVEFRNAYVERTGSRKGGKPKKMKTPYFKGTRVGECFPNEAGHVTNTHDQRLIGLGNALINQNFCVEHVIVNPKERLMAPVEGGTTSWRPDGFYVWTSVAQALASQPVCCAKDLIQVKGGTLRQRRRQQQSNSTEDVGMRSVKVDRVDAKGRGGVNWINLFFLLLLFGPPMMMGGMWIHEYLTTSEVGRALGFGYTHRDRLIQFYDLHNPGKSTITNVDKMLKKYEGREDELFAKLERKYEALERKRKLQKAAEEEDAKEKERGEKVE